MKAPKEPLSDSLDALAYGLTPPGHFHCKCAPFTPDAPAEFPLVPAPDIVAAALRYQDATGSTKLRERMPSTCRMADALRELREECAAVSQEFFP